MSLKTMTAKVGKFWDPIWILKPVKAFYKHAQSWINSLGWKDRIPQDESEFWISKWPEIGLIFFNIENFMQLYVNSDITMKNGQQTCNPEFFSNCDFHV